MRPQRTIAHIGIGLPDVASQLIDRQHIPYQLNQLCLLLDPREGINRGFVGMRYDPIILFCQFLDP